MSYLLNIQEMPPSIHNRWPANPIWENFELPITLDLAEFSRADTQGLAYMVEVHF